MSARTFVVVLAVLAVVGLLGFGLIDKNEEAIAVGDPAPQAELTQLEDGSPATLEDYRGKYRPGRSPDGHERPEPVEVDRFSTAAGEMRPRRLARHRAAAAAACALLGMTLLAGVADAKRKGAKRGGPVEMTKTVAQLVPDASMTAAGVLRSSITIGKQLKGKSIGDVDATVKTTGVGPEAAQDLGVRLTAPNGATATLFNELPGQSVGPLTLDDESPVLICGTDSPPCSDPDATLLFPFFGTASAEGELQIFDRGPIRGNWTVTATDDFTSGTTVLDFWSLRIAPRTPAK